MNVRFKDKSKQIVYSTNPDITLADAKAEVAETLPANEQRLYLHLERKGGGKIVTLVKGFKGSDQDLRQLSKKLKKYCGTGGSVKDGNILVQGNVRDRILGLLSSVGYIVKKSGG